MSYPNETHNEQYFIEQQKEVKRIIKLSKNLSHILQLVSKQTGIRISLIKSKARDRDYVEARAAYSIIAKKRNSDNKTNLTDIGSKINRDHATITHYNNNLSHIPEIMKIVNQIK